MVNQLATRICNTQHPGLAFAFVKTQELYLSLGTESYIAWCLPALNKTTEENYKFQSFLFKWDLVWHEGTANITACGVWTVVEEMLLRLASIKPSINDSWHQRCHSVPPEPKRRTATHEKAQPRWLSETCRFRHSPEMRIKSLEARLLSPRHSPLLVRPLKCTPHTPHGPPLTSLGDHLASFQTPRRLSRAQPSWLFGVFRWRAAVLCHCLFKKIGGGRSSSTSLSLNRSRRVPGNWIMLEVI